jgi:hypothetical protein
MANNIVPLHVVKKEENNESIANVVLSQAKDLLKQV